MSARLIDDTDPRVIKEGTWHVGGKPNDSYKGTLAYTWNVGDSIKVNFNGAYIAVFGLFDSDSEGVVTNYTIDGAPPAQVTTPPAANDILFQQLWMKKGLASGPHTLQITMHKLNSRDGGSVWFDYFQVDNSNTDIQPVTQWNFTSSPTSSDQSHSSHLPIGAIIGIVIGALSFLLGVALLFLIWRRMKRDSRAAPSNKPKNFEPFLLSQHALDPSTSSTQIAVASSAERLLFDPSLLVRGPPVAGSRKSTIMASIPNPDSAPPSTYPRPQSIGVDSSNSQDTLPPGAQPPKIPPVPHLPQRLSTRLTTVQSTTASASLTSSQHPGSSADDTHSVTLVPSSPVGTAVVSEEEITSSTPPRRHVDSGVREPEVILAHSSRQKELPPLYSPT